MKLNIPTYIFGCVRRPSLALDALRAYGEEPVMHIGADYEPPKGTEFKPPYNLALDHKLTAHYRVFRGHRDMAARFLAEHPDERAALMLEDDAVPNCADWQEIVREARSYLGQTGTPTICLHARSVRMANYEKVAEVAGRDMFKLLPGPRANVIGGKHHLYGFTMAYLISRKAAEEFVAGPEWSGIPVDCYMPDTLGTGLLTPSPFNHDRSQGSLVDGKYRKPRL